MSSIARGVFSEPPKEMLPTLMTGRGAFRALRIPFGVKVVLDPAGEPGDRAKRREATSLHSAGIYNRRSRLSSSTQNAGTRAVRLAGSSNFDISGRVPLHDRLNSL